MEKSEVKSKKKIVKAVGVCYVRLRLLKLDFLDKKSTLTYAKVSVLYFYYVKNSNQNAFFCFYLLFALQRSIKRSNNLLISGAIGVS